MKFRSDTERHEANHKRETALRAKGRLVDVETAFEIVPRDRKEADAMHYLLVRRADALMGCCEGSEEAAELEAITDAVEAYEVRRWPDGKVAVFNTDNIRIM